MARALSEPLDVYSWIDASEKLSTAQGRRRPNHLRRTACRTWTAGVAGTGLHSGLGFRALFQGYGTQNSRWVHQPVVVRAYGWCCAAPDAEPLAQAQAKPCVSGDLAPLSRRRPG